MRLLSLHDSCRYQPFITTLNGNICARIAVEMQMIHKVGAVETSMLDFVTAFCQVKKGAGIIINMGSIAAIEPMPILSAYSASKFGVRGWSLNCYEILRKHNIKVVLINPGKLCFPMSFHMGCSFIGIEMHCFWNSTSSA